MTSFKSLINSKKKKSLRVLQAKIKKEKKKKSFKVEEVFWFQIPNLKIFH